MRALLILLACTLPRPKEMPQYVDVIEHNTIVCESGSRFEQLIFWEWNRQYRRHDVRAWSHVPPSLDIDCSNGLYILRLEPYGVITSRIYRETVTEHDPERANLRLMPEQHRRPLLKQMVPSAGG